MYYVLFNYVKKHGKGWLPFSIESKVIEFLHESYEEIEVVQIIEVKATYRLGLTVTEEYIKSSLEPLVDNLEEKSESLVPIEVVDNAKAILREKKRKLEEIEAGEPSAMSKIADDIDEEMKGDELTPEEKTKEALDDADDLIAREKKRQEQKKKGWPLCTKCNSNRTAPHNKKGICTECQQSSEGKRPYTRSKEFAGL